MESQKGKYVKAGVAYTIGNYLLKGISFITLPLFVRLMTTEEYGNFSTYAAYESIFTIIVSLALYSSLKNAKYKFSNTNEFQEYISSCIQISAISTLGVLIICNIFYNYLTFIMDMTRGVMNLMIIQSYAASLLTLYQSYKSLSYKYVSFLRVSFINVISNIGLSLLLMFTVLYNDRYLARVLGTAIPLIIIGIAIIIYFIRIGGFHFNRFHWKYGIKFSIPLVLHGISQVILNQFDRIMIKAMRGAYDAGIYSFGYNISCLIAITLTSLQQVWQPWFYERMAEKDEKAIRNRGKQFSFGMMLFISCVILGINEIVIIMGTSEYRQSIYYLIPLLVGGYFSFLYLLPSQVEYYYEKTSYIAVGTCIAAVFNIAMNYLGIKWFGSIAAAYTTAIIYCFYFFIHFFIATSVHGSSLFELKSIILHCCFLILVAIVSLLLINYWYVRWGLLMAIGIYMLYWLNHSLKLLDSLKNRISSH